MSAFLKISSTLLQDFLDCVIKWLGYVTTSYTFFRNVINGCLRKTGKLLSLSLKKTISATYPRHLLTRHQPIFMGGVLYYNINRIPIIQYANSEEKNNNFNINWFFSYDRWIILILKETRLNAKILCDRRFWILFPLTQNIIKVITSIFQMTNINDSLDDIRFKSCYKLLEVYNEIWKSQTWKIYKLENCRTN